MRLSSRLSGLAAAALAATLSLAAAPATEGGVTEAAGPEPTWASASSATIRPGNQVITDGSQCTSNFVFLEVAKDQAGVEYAKEVLIGMAAHCAGTGSATTTNGCVAGSKPLGTPVTVKGAGATGTLVYSSWLTMQSGKEADGNACAANDFALVSLAKSDWGKVNPSMPYWGGPTGLASTVSTATDLYSYGNSGLRAGLTQLSPKVETKITSSYGGWSHITYAVSPGIPGDSGSGHLDEAGRAFGVTSTIYLTPYPAGNGVTDLKRSLDYARAKTGRDYRLVNGTVPFSTPLP